jgi:putative transposase
MVMCLKYRKLLLRQKDNIDSLRIIFQEIGEGYWFEFDEIGTDGDHVHVFVGAAPKLVAFKNNAGC